MTAIATQNLVNMGLNYVGTAGYHMCRAASTLIPTVLPSVATSMAIGYDVKKGIIQGLAASAVGPWIVKPWMDYVQRNSGTGPDKIQEKAKKFFSDMTVFEEAGLPVAFTCYAGDYLLQLLTTEQRSLLSFFSTTVEYTASRGLVAAGAILLGKHLYDNQDTYKAALTSVTSSLHLKAKEASKSR